MKTDTALETVAQAIARGELTKTSVWDYLRGAQARTAKGATITIRVSPDDKAEIRRKAQSAGRNITDYILARCMN